MEIMCIYIYHVFIHVYICMYVCMYIYLLCNWLMLWLYMRTISAAAIIRGEIA